MFCIMIFFAYLNSYFVILAMAKVAIQIHFTGQSPGYFSLH